MKKWIVWFVFAAAVIIGLKCGSENQCVMRIGSERLNIEDAVKIYRMSQEARKPGKVTIADAKEFCLTRFSRDMYYLAEAKSLGIPEEDSIKAKIIRQKKKILTRDLGLLYNQIVSDVKEPTEEDLRPLYDKRHWEYKLAHILMPAPQLADSVFNLAKNGVPFQQLVAQFSFDRRFADKKGQWVDWFLYGTMGGDFDDTVISLKPGVTSKPIHTRYGYHIVRVLKKRERNQLPFKQIIPWLRATYTSMQRERKMFHYKQALIEKYRFQVNEAAARSIIKAYREDQKGLPLLPKTQFTRQQLDATLATFDGGEFKVRDFVREYNSERPILLPPLHRVDAVAEYAKKAAMVDMMYVDAVKRGLDKDPDYQNAVWLYSKNLYITECQKRIAQPFEITREEIRQRYDADSTFHKQSFEEAAKWVERGIRTEKMNAEYRRQLKYLQEKYPVEFCNQGLKKLVKRMEQVKIELINKAPRMKK